MMLKKKIIITNGILRGLRFFFPVVLTFDHCSTSGASFESDGKNLLMMKQVHFTVSFSTRPFSTKNYVKLFIIAFGCHQHCPYYQAERVMNIVDIVLVFGYNRHKFLV